MILGESEHFAGTWVMSSQVRLCTPLWAMRIKTKREFNLPNLTKLICKTYLTLSAFFIQWFANIKSFLLVAGFFSWDAKKILWINFVLLIGTLETCETYFKNVFKQQNSHKKFNLPSWMKKTRNTTYCLWTRVTIKEITKIINKVMPDEPNRYHHIEKNLILWTYIHKIISHC